MKKEISYKIRKSKRAKRVRLAVYCDGSVVVTSPMGVDKNIIEKFVRDKWQWIKNKLEFFENADEKLIRTFSKEDYLKYKDEALKLVEKKVKKFNKIYNFKYNKIFIKNQKTRWGSCSEKGNLNFNYKILFLEEKLQDYVIVHELCHLKEFNHSRKFWSLVGKALPEYLNIKKEIRRQEMLYR